MAVGIKTYHPGRCESGFTWPLIRTAYGPGIAAACPMRSLAFYSVDNSETWKAEGLFLLVGKNGGHTPPQVRAGDRRETFAGQWFREPWK